MSSIFFAIVLSLAAQAPAATDSRSLSPPPPPPPPPLQWHIAQNGQTLGPYSMGELAEAIATNRVRPDTLVWTVGMADWTAATQIPQIAALFPPPLPPR